MSDPPRRWADDSPEEDAEVRRARELAGLEQWAAGQRTRPLTDALAEHGLIRDPGESWAGPLILPDWWDDVTEPGAHCPWCQRPGVPAPCPECRQARATDCDPAALTAWWAGCSAAQRRLHIAATYGTDPWSARHCAIRMEWTTITATGEVQTTRPLSFGSAPRGIYWGTRRASGLP